MQGLATPGSSRFHARVINTASWRLHDRNGLTEAGEILVTESENENLCMAGQALVQSATAWDNEWADVTMGFSEASACFYSLAEEEQESCVKDLYTGVADELEDASTIQGCTSVGPPSSIPNLVEIQRLFLDLSSSEHKDLTFFRNAANAIGRLIDEI